MNNISEKKVSLPRIASYLKKAYYIVSIEDLINIIEDLTCRRTVKVGLVTKLKNLSDVHSILLGAVENVFN